METVEQTEKTPDETGSEEVITFPQIPDLAIDAVPREVLKQARAAIPRLRALQEAILADRGGKPFTEEEISGALHAARAAHKRGE